MDDSERNEELAGVRVKKKARSRANSDDEVRTFMQPLAQLDSLLLAS